MGLLLLLINHQTISPTMATQPASGHVVGSARVSAFYVPENMMPLMNACSSGDIGRVEEFFDSDEQKKDNHREQRYLFWPPLLESMVQGHLAVTSYLLDAGVPFSDIHIEEALKQNSTAMFDILLRHGWDFHKPRSEMNPPPLA